jgi:acetylornithine deacetylase
VDEVTRRLCELVALPSVNPMGRPDAEGPPYLECRVTDYLECVFRDLGVRTERTEIAPGRSNLLAFYDAPTASPRRILWDVHQDTVPVEGMTVPAFEATIEGGRLYARGACDVKGSMAAMLVAFGRLVRERPRGSASVVLACTVDEEYTHLGSSLLARHRPPVDLAVVAEPTRLDLIVAHKGAIRWKMHTRGVACHSSSPELGQNAIYRMAQALGALEAHAADLAAGQRHPLLGPASLSVGKIEGGVAANVVPDHCSIEIDRRLLPGERPADAMHAATEAVGRRLGSGYDVSPPWVHMPAFESRLEEGWLEAIAGAVTRSTGGKVPARGGVPFGTDAGPLAESGLPCVVLGPGDIAQAHTKDEWIDLDELGQAVEVYYEIAREPA